MREATEALAGLGFAEKNELLFARGVNFNDLPLWQKHGTGVYWQTVERSGFNPVTQQATTAVRKRMHVDEELPRGDAFADLVSRLVAGALRTGED